MNVSPVVLHRAWVRLAASACLLLAGAPSSSPAQERTFERSLVRIVVLKARDGKAACCFTGTGFSINRDGYLVTNHHVVQDAVAIFVLAEGQRSDPRQGFDVDNDFEGTNIERNPWLSAELDLAILKVKPSRLDELRLDPVPLTSRKPGLGSRVLVQGYPGFADDAVGASVDLTANSTFISGEIARMEESPWSGFKESVQKILHTAPINSGNSGGPLFDACGRVVGVNTAGPAERSEVVNEKGKVTGETRTKNTSYGIASGVNELIEVLDSRNIPYLLDEAPCGPGASGGLAGAPPWLLYAVAGLLLCVAGGAGFLSLRRIAPAAAGPGSGMGVPSAASRDAVRPPSLSIASGSPTPTSMRQGVPSIILDPKDSRATKIVIRAEDLARKEVVVGRSPGGRAYQIPDESVSRYHCAFAVRGGVPHVQDRGSTNGTHVGGRTLKGDGWVSLDDGAELRIGSVRFRVRIT